MKVGQLIENSVRKILFKNHAENEADILVPDLFLLVRKALSEEKKVSLVSISFGSPRLGDTIKTNCMKLQTLNPEILSILIFKKMVSG